ncbi:MAG: alpha/beta hydrolase [Leeuwenhoekiella sp.]
MRKSLKKIIPKAIGHYINTLALVAPDAAARKAFGIFSKPRQGKVGEHHKGFMDPSRDIKLKVGNINLQTYKWPAAGKTILLIHGWESHTHRWKVLAEKLHLEGYNIVAFDAPGHGYSEGERLYVPIYAEAVHKMIEIYNPEILISHSIGALTAIYSQSKNPSEKIKKMVVLGSPDKLENILADFQRVLGLNKRVLGILDQYFQKRFGFKTDEFSASLFAKKLSIPALIIHDKDDKITSVEGSRSIHKNWKNSKYIETEGLNHSLYSDDVNNEIVSFLKEAE